MRRPGAGGAFAADGDRVAQIHVPGAGEDRQIGEIQIRAGAVEEQAVRRPVPLHEGARGGAVIDRRGAELLEIRRHQLAPHQPHLDRVERAVQEPLFQAHAAGLAGVIVRHPAEGGNRPAERIRRVGFHHVAEHRKLAGDHRVVIADIEQVIAAGFCQAEFEIVPHRHPRAGVQHLQARIVEGGQNLGSIIGAGIVADDHLDIRIVNRQSGLQRIMQVKRALARRDDDTDLRRHGGQATRRRKPSGATETSSLWSMRLSISNSG